MPSIIFVVLKVGCLSIDAAYREIARFVEIAKLIHSKTNTGLVEGSKISVLFIIFILQRECSWQYTYKKSEIGIQIYIYRMICEIYFYLLIAEDRFRMRGYHCGFLFLLKSSCTSLDNILINMNILTDFFIKLLNYEVFLKLVSFFIHFN